MKMKKYRQARGNSTLEIDGKPLVFVDGVLTVKTVSKDLQALIDSGYIVEVKDEPINE